MKTIIITGPSGSGKTILTNKLSKEFKDSIVIRTDSFYRDNILIRLISIFKRDIYDRFLSIKKKELNDTLKSIFEKKKIIIFYNYDFKRKKSSQKEIKIKYKDENQFLILEGIFSHRLNLNYHETINIVCYEKKEVCRIRRLNRDKLERGRNSNEVNKKFNKSWYLFYNNLKTNLHQSNQIKLNPADKISYNKLLDNLRKIFRNEKTKKNK